MNFDKELDVRGLVCPLPLLRTKKALATINLEETLKIVATDPGSVIDFQAYVDQTNHELLSSLETNNEFIYYIKKNKSRDWKY